MLLTSGPRDLQDLPRTHRRPALTHDDLPGHPLLSGSLPRSRGHDDLPLTLTSHRARGHEPRALAGEAHLRPGDRRELLRGQGTRRPLQRDSGRMLAHDARLRLGAGPNDRLGADDPALTGHGAGRAGDVLGGAAHRVAGGDAAQHILEGGAEHLAALGVGDLLELLRGQGRRGHRPGQLDGVAAEVDLWDRRLDEVDVGSQLVLSIVSLKFTSYGTCLELSVCNGPIL